MESFVHSSRLWAGSLCVVLYRTHSTMQHTPAFPQDTQQNLTAAVQMLRAAGRRHNESVNGTNEPTDQIHYQLMQSTWLIGKQLGLLCIFARSSQSQGLTSLRSTSGYESIRQSDDHRLPGAKVSSSMGPCV